MGPAEEEAETLMRGSMAPAEAHESGSCTADRIGAPSARTERMAQETPKASFVDPPRRASEKDAPSSPAKRDRVVPAKSNNPQSTIADPAPIKSADKEGSPSKPRDEGAGDARGGGGKP